MSSHIEDRDVPQHRDVAVLVPAAGQGLRLGGGVPKALRELAGQPLLVHACARLAQAPSVALIVVAAPADQVDAVRELLPDATVVPGGATRQQSVANALAAVPAGIDIVLVHDAARALTPPELVESVAAAVRAGHDAVIPVLPVVDTVKRVDATGAVLETVDRAALRVVQTPQGFRRGVLAKAHAEAASEHTDDAGMVERLGLPVYCVPGSDHALKITRPLDLAIAAALLSL
ncbi:2-C-methyl-D-erythritol 4-phosphate cytidylyltransferase [Catellatospora sp. KI3]|uniref:2-C-methyl-D-erythritol 4-phosphate cytidylyltransferase n=1 Tax=Catellatospora sp. KI3 TaxID=3041620 RepID=UPI0024831A81|nr:2-C-methyl-D-erythritol 4-phosphate cytidylyltransferase [Catellatospora sp. KI3]MDI1465126.1 2-C-methyl-D-erythritol 4-phosphate cytidylyltransferase [Catellatospora sp. KI3]